MSYSSDLFGENTVILSEPTLTSDDIIELYQDDEYIATISVDHILATLQEILVDDLDDDCRIEDDGAEWLKAVSLRIAAAILRDWVGKEDIDV